MLQRTDGRRRGDDRLRWRNWSRSEDFRLWRWRWRNRFCRFLFLFEPGKFKFKFGEPAGKFLEAIPDTDGACNQPPDQSNWNSQNNQDNDGLHFHILLERTIRLGGTN